MTSLTVITRFSIQLFSMLFNFLQLAYRAFKWFLDFLLYHPFYSLHVHHHQPLHQEFQMVTEDRVEIWRPRRREGGGGGGEVDCAVCLSKIGEGEEVKVLIRCKHVFHRDCLNQWFDLRNFTCPLCRDSVGSGIRSVVHGLGGTTHEIFFRFSSSSNSERENWWLR